MTSSQFIPLDDFPLYPPEVMEQRSADFYSEMRRRRTVRHFSPEPVPRSVIENCIRTATTAPNGANKQPWHFAVVSDPAVKRQIRLAAEEEERAFYGGRATDEWLEALAPLGTDANKPFLEEAPYLVVVFAQSYGLGEAGQRVKHYYVQESVGIATGLLIAACHHAGLATLTHTPSPMQFLSQVLERPDNERPYLILVVGLPASDARVPDIRKKTLPEVTSYY